MPLTCPNWWAQQVTILRPLACKVGQPGRRTWLDEAQCAIDQRRRSLTVGWGGLVSAVVATCTTRQPTSSRSLRPSSAAYATWTSSYAPRRSASCGGQAHQPGPHHPAFTYHGWLWDTRCGPRTPLARSLLSWSDATASCPTSGRVADGRPD